MEPTGLLMAALVIGLLVLALGIDQAIEDVVRDVTSESGPVGKTQPRVSRDCP